MTLIRCAGVLGVLDVAFDVFELSLRAPGGGGDTLMYNNMLEACVSCKQGQKAEQLFKRMKQGPAQPDLVTYNTVARGLAQTDKWQGAFALLGEMREHGVQPNSVTFNSLVHACVSHGDAARAWEVL